jgi:hypothetical protein
MGKFELCYVMETNKHRSVEKQTRNDGFHMNIPTSDVWLTDTETLKPDKANMKQNNRCDDIMVAKLIVILIILVPLLIRHNKAWYLFYQTELYINYM